MNKPQKPGANDYWSIYSIKYLKHGVKLWEILQVTRTLKKYLYMEKSLGSHIHNSKKDVWSQKTRENPTFHLRLTSGLSANLDKYWIRVSAHNLGKEFVLCLCIFWRVLCLLALVHGIQGNLCHNMTREQLMDTNFSDRTQQKIKYLEDNLNRLPQPSTMKKVSTHLISKVTTF